ncbi:hypothetical protein AVEN_131484-1 [Araneus ventricosus]|uniref:Uncharacterized protein n=1 Tax=Araneus ventricosus TaxID=182803 RepID=A0A4Y2MRR3_ARAVE|nr:hypothetical protein AVEN_131484-1 [Araneus ventricosus]
MTSQDEILKNPSLLSTIPNLNGNNAGECFPVLEETAVLGQWSKPQLIAIGELKLEGRARWKAKGHETSLLGFRAWPIKISMAVMANGMSEELREKMSLSQFTAGLKPTARAQILIGNPAEFQEEVEVAYRIEKAQNMLTPNINVESSLTGSETNIERLIKSSTENYTKTIDWLSKLLEKINGRLVRLENEKESKKLRVEILNRRLL